jgi:hypothetical protein
MKCRVIMKLCWRPVIRPSAPIFKTGLIVQGRMNDISRVAIKRIGMVIRCIIERLIIFVSKRLL